MKLSDIEIGAWVRTHRTGIWKVYRVLVVKHLNPFTGDEAQHSTIFVKRFLSDSFRKSFTEDCCHSSLIFPLEKNDTYKLDEFISNHEKIYSQFEQYQPKPINSVYNARITIPHNQTVAQVQNKLSTECTFHEYQIEPYLRGQGFLTDQYPQWTIQFVCHDHQCENGALQYKFERVMKY